MKVAKKLVISNTMSNGSLDTDRCMRACLLYRNSVLNPGTCRTIAQTLMGQHLRDALPAVKEFYQVKKEFVMERKEQELLVAKLNTQYANYNNRGSKTLPELAVGNMPIKFRSRIILRSGQQDGTGLV